MHRNIRNYLQRARLLIRNLSKTLSLDKECDLDKANAVLHHFISDENDLSIQMFKDFADYLLSPPPPPPPEPEDNEPFSDARSPVSVFDVAAYILKKIGPLPAAKLQMLLYYCQAWSLVWNKTPIFLEPIEAWKDGPAVKPLFTYCRNNSLVSRMPLGTPGKLTPSQKKNIDAVLNFTGPKTARQLMEISRMEAPWQRARIGVPPQEDGNHVISIDIMREYYKSAAKSQKAR